MAKVFPGSAHPRSGGGRSINPTDSQHFRRSSIRMPHLPLATFVLRPPGGQSVHMLIQVELIVSGV